METRDPITPETFLDAVWAEFEALNLPDIPTIGKRISFAPFAELYSALSKEHRVDLARVWTMFEQELQRPAIVRMRCVATIFEMADVLDIDMPGYDSSVMEHTAEIEPPERTDVRIEREDLERRKNILMCAALIQETVQEMGQDPREIRDGELEHLRHALAAVAGLILNTDPDGEDLADEPTGELDSQVEDQAGEHQEQLDKAEPRAKDAPEAARRTWSAWPVVSAGLAAAFLMFIWVGIAEHESLSDENRALRAQLAERGERTQRVIVEHPIAVLPVKHRVAVEPGMPLTATIERVEPEGNEWWVRIEQVEALPGRAPGFSGNDLTQGVSVIMQGQNCLIRSTGSTP